MIWDQTTGPTQIKPLTWLWKSPTDFEVHDFDGPVLFVSFEKDPCFC